MIFLKIKTLLCVFAGILVTAPCYFARPLTNDSLFLNWLKKHDYIKKDTFVETVNSNRVPNKIMGMPADLRVVFTRFGIEDQRIKMDFGVNNGVCYVVNASGEFYLLLFGSPRGKDPLQSLISKAAIIKKMPDEKLSNGLRALFGQPPIKNPSSDKSVGGTAS